MYARIVPGIFGFPASLAIVIVIGVVLLPGLTLVAAAKALGHLGIRRRLTQAAEKPFSGRPGPAVLRGRVVAGGDDLAPVEVSIEQVGTEVELKRGFRTDWSEVRREVRMTPFEVETADGLRVHVEPDATTRLVDDLDEIEVTGSARRVCRARLSPDEEVWVVGAMRPRNVERAAESAYRGGVSTSKDAPRPLAMRGLPGQPLLLSSRPLGSDRTMRAVFHGVAALVLFAMTLAFHLSGLYDFHRSAWSGTVVEARAIGARTQTEWVRSKYGGHAVEHKLLRLGYTLPSGNRGSAEVEVAKQAYDAYEKRGADKWVLRVTPGPHPVAFIGRYPHVTTKASNMAAFGLLLAAAYIIGALTFFRPWYERKRFDQSTEGRIPLFISPPAEPDTAAARHGRADAHSQSEVEADLEIAAEALAEQEADAAAIPANRSRPPRKPV
ncbi:MAG: hypothetical protein HOV80_24695 [Polyangiaceae bacterium]|nr:hypothetical protein [Polyangiaceae bacterium]